MYVWCIYIYIYIYIRTHYIILYRINHVLLIERALRSARIRRAERDRRTPRRPQRFPAASSPGVLQRFFVPSVFPRVPRRLTVSEFQAEDS